MVHSELSHLSCFEMKYIMAGIMTQYEFEQASCAKLTSVLGPAFPVLACVASCSIQSSSTPALHVP